MIGGSPANADCTVSEQAEEVTEQVSSFTGDVQIAVEQEYIEIVLPGANVLAPNVTDTDAAFAGSKVHMHSSLAV